MQEHSPIYTLLNGLVGASASFLGVISTFQEQFEYGIRIAGGLIGILIGLITLWNFFRKKK